MNPGLRIPNLKNGSAMLSAVRLKPPCLYHRETVCGKYLFILHATLNRFSAVLLLRVNIYGTAHALKLVTMRSQFLKIQPEHVN